MPLPAPVVANIKAFRREIRAPQADGRTSNAPLLVAMEATSRCNFRCVHCSQSFTTRKRTDLSLELFLQVAPLARTAFEVYLFGDGEVLLDVPRHLAMVARIHQLAPFASLGFSTNGKLLTPEVYELYAAAGIDYIQVSIDAGSKELYERMRRGGSFDELLRNLEGIAAVRRRARAAQPQLRLATVISQQNYRELPLLAALAREFGFCYWYINAEYPHNPGRDQLRLGREQITELEAMRSAFAGEYGSELAILFDPAIGLPAAREEKWLQPAASPVFCTAPWQMFLLNANGDVKICPYFHKPVGSLDGRDVAEVWNGEELRSIRRAFTDGKALPRYCVDCDRGIRRQYLPGYPGMPDTKPVQAVFRRISGLYHRFLNA